MRSTVERTDVKELLKIMGEKSPVGVCIIQDGKFCYVNSNFLFAIGYTADELMGKDPLEFIVPEDREMVRENAIKMLKGELLSPYQFRVICKNGSIRWVMETVTSIQYHGRRAVLGNDMDITERKWTEGQIRESERHYRLLAENAEDVIWTVDIACPTRLTYISPSVTRLLGYSVEESMTKEMEVIFTPASFNSAMKALAEEMAGEQKEHAGRHRSRRLELQLRHKNGSVVDVEVNFSFIRGANGQKGEILAVARDITGRKQMEEALRESEERYRELANSITDVFFAMDEHLRYTYWNKASEILTRIRAVDAIGKPLREIFPDTPGVRKAEKVYRKVAKTQQPQTFVNDLDINGRHYIFEISAYPSRGGISVFAKDITEHKQAEKALRESEERFRSIVENSQAGIIILDDAYRCVYVNDELYRISGYPREEVIGQDFRQFLDEESKEFVTERYRGRQRGEEVSPRYEFSIVKRDGQKRRVEISSTVIEDSAGGVKTVAQILDITERKQAEERLKESEQKYRLLFETSLDYIAQIDREGRYLAANPATAKSLGVPLEELIGKTIFEVQPQKVAQHRLMILRKALDEWQPQIFEDERAGRYFHHVYIPTKISEQKEVVQMIARDITDRRKMEEALRQSEEKYRALFDSSVIGMFVMDAETMKIVMCNRAAAKMFGFSSVEEAIGINPLDFVLPEYREKALEIAMKELFEQDLRRTHEYRVVNKDGREGWVSVTGARIMLEGKLAGLVSITDITERKQAEEELSKSQAHLSSAVQMAHLGPWEYDAINDLFIFNDAFYELFHTTAEEVGGYTMSSAEYARRFVYPEDAHLVGEEVRKALQADDPNFSRQLDHRIIYADGEVGYISVRLFIVKDETGSTVRTYGVNQDITERKRMEEALRQSEENYRALFDSSVIGTFVLDAETMKVVMANQAAAKIFGFNSAEEGIGLNPVDFVLSEDEERVLEVIVKELFEQDLRRTNEFRAVTKDGREIWISAMGARIMHEGRLAALISFTDITEQKRQNEQLMTTDRLASLGELAAGTAHELNNPLTSIIGFSQLLMEKEVPDGIREDLKLIYSEAQRAVNVTKDLLAFARKHASLKQRNQVNNIIEDVLELRAYEHKVKSIEVERHLAPNLPEIMVDYFQMQQVFMNIIINAEYFMTEAHNKGTLTITTKKQNNTVRISITDDGPGIPPENLKQIFDPFFTTKEAGKGTGLGLSICHGIVTEHGGQIYVKSQLGKGATIFVELPINVRDHIKSML